MSAFRERLGQLIYEAVYADQGGKWEAVEPREVWYAKADWLMAQEPCISVAPEMLKVLKDLELYAPDPMMSFFAQVLRDARAVVAKAEGRS